MTRTISGGKISRIGASVRSVYSAVARSGSISIAHRFGTPAIGVIAWPIGCSNTSARLEAGSVVTIRTRVPASASATAVVQAIVVLPTPPLPEKKRNWVTGGSFRWRPVGTGGQHSPRESFDPSRSALSLQAPERARAPQARRTGHRAEVVVLLELAVRDVVAHCQVAVVAEGEVVAGHVAPERAPLGRVPSGSGRCSRPCRR